MKSFTSIVMLIAALMGVGAGSMAGCHLLPLNTPGNVIEDVSILIHDAEIVLQILDSAFQQFSLTHKLTDEQMLKYNKLRSDVTIGLNNGLRLAGDRAKLSQEEQQVVFKDFLFAYNMYQSYLQELGVVGDNGHVKMNSESVHMRTPLLVIKHHADAGK